MNTFYTFQKAASASLIICIAACARADTLVAEVSQTDSHISSADQLLQHKIDVIEHFKNRYQLQTSNQKLVNNFGNGFEPLYGVRNFRTILHGVAYRGGANNYYNKNGKRDNRNPLPNEGLQNLCQEGFSNAIYLYSTNYETANKQTFCSSPMSSSALLTYDYTSPYNSASVRKLLTAIYNRIQNPDQGPVYIHCWNGWHASGLSAALALRQFCDYTAEEAIAYWELNTDGYDKDPAFEKVREQIRKFTPLSDLAIHPKLKPVLCPL